jgi:hypothetical protein
LTMGPKGNVALIASCLTLSQCGPLHTAIKNETGQPVKLRVEAGSSVVVDTELEADQTLSIAQSVGRLSRIAYSTGSKVCQLRGRQISRSATHSLYGKPEIILAGCR